MRRSIVVALLLVPAVALAQEPSPAPGSYTRMILGAGGMPGNGLTFLVGVDHKKKASKLGLRVAAEYQDNGPNRFAYQQDEVNFSKTYGLQVLGVRPFREGRRLEPYLFAGVGVYHRDRTYYQPFGSDVANWTGGEIVRRHETAPELLWGFGTNVRVKGMTLFGDVKLPTWGGNYRNYGRAGTFKIGFRF